MRRGWNRLSTVRVFFIMVITTTTQIKRLNQITTFINLAVKIHLKEYYSPSRLLSISVEMLYKVTHTIQQVTRLFIIWWRDKCHNLPIWSQFTIGYFPHRGINRLVRHLYSLTKLTEVSLIVSRCLAGGHFVFSARFPTKAFKPGLLHHLMAGSHTSKDRLTYSQKGLYGIEGNSIIYHYLTPVVSPRGMCSQWKDHHMYYK